MNSNPLTGYFRSPALYISLPSAGKFYAESAIEKTDNGLYPVFPMSSADDLAFRAAVALENSSAALVGIVQSCVPNIKNGWAMPAVDIDKVLTAVRIATYGSTLVAGCKCPECENQDQITVNLQSLMDQIASPDFDSPMVYNDLKIYFTPMTYQQLNQNGVIHVSETSIVDLLADETIDDQAKLDQISIIVKQVNELTVVAVAKNIQKVQTPETEVTDRQHIIEWLKNCDQATFSAVKNYILKLKSTCELRPLSVTCSRCGAMYDQPIPLSAAENNMSKDVT